MSIFIRQQLQQYAQIREHEPQHDDNYTYFVKNQEPEKYILTYTRTCWCIAIKSWRVFSLGLLATCSTDAFKCAFYYLFIVLLKKKDTVMQYKLFQMYNRQDVFPFLYNGTKIIYHAHKPISIRCVLHSKHQSPVPDVTRSHVPMSDDCNHLIMNIVIRYHYPVQ